MKETRFWMVRHALVDPVAQAMIYGVMDVALCAQTLADQAPMYAALARRLPRPASWLVSPLSRTQKTADAIFAAGYPRVTWRVEPGLVEMHFGEWQGLAHADVRGRLTAPPHPFWPIAGDERPPGGETFAELIARVGPAMGELADRHAGEDVVAVSHGGTIRAAVAHALSIDATQALHLSVGNISLTRLDRVGGVWRVVCVNEQPGV